jgi:ribosomal protein S12 methylthiotransferase accessory factor
MAEEDGVLAARFMVAAAALAADPGLHGLSAEHCSLLKFLGYDDGDAAAAGGRARMLRAAARLRRVFLLPVPDSPGVVFFGGEADPAVFGARQRGAPIGSLAGSGLSSQRAFEACVGEGIEYLSQFVQTEDAVASGTFSEYRNAHDADASGFIAALLSLGKVDFNRSIAWVPVRRLLDGAEVFFPLDVCYRRPPPEQDFMPALKLSTGCAAGATIAEATLRAVLELIERDAVALWWRGGRRGRSIASRSAAGVAAADLLAKARQGKQDRQSWVLDVTTDVGIPAVAAISRGADGYGFAFGFGARLSLVEAVRAAIFELCQVELGQHVVAAKRRESGDGALNDSDRRQLRRATLFDTRDCALLQPEGEVDTLPTVLENDPIRGLEHVLARLSALGIAAYGLDLTRPEFGIPVFRVLAPGLQLEPCQIVGKRLAGVIHETGGGGVHTGGIQLL